MNSSCLFVCLRSSYNFTVSGGPNSSLIKVYILEYIFTSNRQSTVRIQSSIVSAFVRVSHRRSLVVLASRRRSRVASASKRRLTAWSPVLLPRGRHRHVVAGIRTGDTCYSGRRGGRPSPAGNARVFSLTLAAPVFRDIAENPTSGEKTIYHSATDTRRIHVPRTNDGGDSSLTSSTELLKRANKRS